MTDKRRKTSAVRVLAGAVLFGATLGAVAGIGSHAVGTDVRPGRNDLAPRREVVAARLAAEDDPATVDALARCRASGLALCQVERDADGRLSVYGYPSARSAR